MWLKYFSLILNNFVPLSRRYGGNFSFLISLQCRLSQVDVTFATAASFSSITSGSAIFEAYPFVHSRFKFKHTCVTIHSLKNFTPPIIVRRQIVAEHHRSYFLCQQLHVEFIHRHVSSFRNMYLLPLHASDLWSTTWRSLTTHKIPFVSIQRSFLNRHDFRKNASIHSPRWISRFLIFSSKDGMEK